jgi:predicted DNA-binding protein (UPF0251 family)
MGKRPTTQQIEAYRFVIIHQCKHSEAAKLMGCSRPNVTRLLLRLKKSNPHLFLKKGKITIIHYHNGLDNHIADKF